MMDIQCVVPCRHDPLSPQAVETLHVELSKRLVGTQARMLYCALWGAAGSDPVVRVRATREQVERLRDLPQYSELGEPFVPSAGEAATFLLVCNPVTRIGANQQKVAQDAADVRAWLERRGAGGGFEIIDLDTQFLKPLRTHKRIAGGRTLSLQHVRVAGRLRVTDEARFRQAIADGIGFGKAFGLGLLMTFRD